MTYNQKVKNLVSTLAAQLKVPYSYYQFEEQTSPPFLVYNFPNNDDMYADNENYKDIVVFELFFCSDEKEFKIERTIEAFLKSNGLSFYKEQLYIDDESMWQITYTMEVIG